MEAQILNILMQRILKGTYAPGTKMPSENALADSLGVTRIRIRKAYEALESLGYLTSSQGCGWFLREKKSKIFLHLGGKESFTEKMRNQGYPVVTKNIGSKPINVKGTSSAAKVLGLDPNSSHRLIKIGRLRILQTTPIALHISYLNPTTFPNIEEVSQSITSIYSYFNTNGYTNLSSSTSQLSITLPTAFEHEYLQCPVMVPLILLESGTRDDDTNIVLEYTKILYRSDMFTYYL
jgi:GntR family transcriptional regulator